MNQKVSNLEREGEVLTPILIFKKTIALADGY